MARLGAGFKVKKVGARTVVVAAKKANKYGAEKRKVDGITFDSIKESKRYGELKLEERAGAITYLEVYPEFDLFVRGYYVDAYFADFTYYRGRRRVVEDVKSEATKTPLYKLKKTLMKAIYGIDVVEV